MFSLMSAIEILNEQRSESGWFFCGVNNGINKGSEEEPRRRKSVFVDDFLIDG